MKVSYSYLSEQFGNPEPIINDIRKLISSGDFTLGKALEQFEEKFSEICHTKYAVGVGSGTDALRLSLIALGIGPGDEVITTPLTFYATIGAIVTVGATPVFVDVAEDYNIDAGLVEKYITSKIKAILPVHWHGHPADMHKLLSIAKKHNLFIVEDACMAMGAEISGKRTGSFGDTGCFSLHPLKPVNVWGDGGVITTNSLEIRDKLLLLRNHGLKNRDECELFSFNSRLDSLQAIVGNHLIRDFEWIINSKIQNAAFYDQEFRKIPEVIVPRRDSNIKSVYHNYVIMVKRRDELLSFLKKNDIDAKVHYPIPLHLQKASSFLNHKEGDFPNAEHQCKKAISLPVHQHLSREQREYVVAKVKEFYHV